ncbi:GvpL/GvpF family gas vesicle protein [Streptomyces griseus]|uniref:GvpL/GvpF family gas vesicle protein n=1 Tax=Streptomyces griseus TaxID=1911 RepID=UPI0008400898|nr:GvpL/GvpF family gas vesicle protein [Streptomyces griseus]
MREWGSDSSDAAALYVFAVCDAPDPALFADVPGFAVGGPLRGLRCGELTAVVQTVPAADFTDEAWQARMSDRGELERYARAHHHVVSAAAALWRTVPLPLATLYHGEDRARQALIAETERFRAALKRTADHAEWGVKVYAAPPPTDEPSPALRASGSPAGRSRPVPGAGLAYLDRKRGIQARRERRHEESLRVADTVDAAFRNVAAEVRRLRLHGPELTGTSRLQILNATYLMAENRADELAPLVRELRERTGAEIELSGPWVPYSFIGEV